MLRYILPVLLVLLLTAVRLTAQTAALRHVTLGPVIDGKPSYYLHVHVQCAGGADTTLDSTAFTLRENWQLMPLQGFRPPHAQGGACHDVVTLFDNSALIDSQRVAAMISAGNIFIDVLTDSCQRVGIQGYDTIPIFRQALSNNRAATKTAVAGMKRAGTGLAGMIDALLFATAELNGRGRAADRYILLAGTGHDGASRNAIAGILPTGTPDPLRPRILTVALGDASGADTLRRIAAMNGGVFLASTSRQLPTLYDSLARAMGRQLDEYRLHYVSDLPVEQIRALRVEIRTSCGKAVAESHPLPPAAFVLSDSTRANSTLFRMDHTGSCDSSAVTDTLHLHWQESHRLGDTSDVVRYTWHALVDSIGAGAPAVIDIAMPSDNNGRSASITLSGPALRDSIFNRVAPGTKVLRLRWFVEARNTAGLVTRSDTAGVSTQHAYAPGWQPTADLIMTINRPPSAVPHPRRLLDGTTLQGIDSTSRVDIGWTAATDADIDDVRAIGGFRRYDAVRMTWSDDSLRQVDTLSYQWFAEVASTHPAGTGAPIGTRLVRTTGRDTTYRLTKTDLDILFGSSALRAESVMLDWYVYVKDADSSDACRPHEAVGGPYRLTLTRAALALDTPMRRNRDLFRMDRTGGCAGSAGLAGDTLRLQWEAAFQSPAGGAGLDGDTVSYLWHAIVERYDTVGVVDDSLVTLPSDGDGLQPRIAIDGATLRSLLWPADALRRDEAMVQRVRWFVTARSSMGLAVTSDTAGVSSSGARTPTPAVVVSVNLPPEESPRALAPADGVVIGGIDSSTTIPLRWSAALDSNISAGRRNQCLRRHDAASASWVSDSLRSIDTLTYQWVAVVESTIPHDAALTGTTLVRRTGTDTSYNLSWQDLAPLLGGTVEFVRLRWYVQVKDADSTDTEPREAVDFRSNVDGSLVADTTQWSRYGCRPHELVGGPFLLDLTRVGAPSPFVLSTSGQSNRDLFRMDRTGVCSDNGLVRDTLRLHWQASQARGTLDTVRYEWCAMVDSDGSAVHRVVVASDGGGLQPTLTLPADRLRTLLYPPTEPRTADSLVLRVHWYVRARSSYGLETFSDTTGVTAVQEAYPDWQATAPLLLSLNRAPDIAPRPLQPPPGATFQAIDTNTTIPISWTEAGDMNLVKGRVVGGFRSWDATSQTWIDDADRTVDTLTYQWIGLVVRTFPSTKGPRPGTVFVRETGDVTQLVLAGDDLAALFAGFSTDTASTSADSVVLDWFVHVKDAATTDALPMEEVGFRHLRDGSLAADTARWSRFGCRPHELVMGPVRLHLTRLGLGGVEISPGQDSVLRRVAGEDVPFTLVARDLRGNVIRDWNVQGQDVTLTLIGSAANSDSSRRSWNDDTLGYTYAEVFVQGTGQRLARVGDEAFLVPVSAFVNGSLGIVLRHTRADSSVALQVSPILPGLRQTSARMYFAAGAVTNYFVDLTSASDIARDVVYWLRRYEVVVAARDRYMNVCNERVPTRFSARLPGEFTSQVPGVSDVLGVDKVVTVSGVQSYYFASRVVRTREAGDQLQWLQVYRDSVPNVRGETVSYEVRSHAPRPFSLLGPVDADTIRLGYGVAHRFEWEQGGDPYANIRVSRFSPVVATDTVRYSIVFLDPLSLTRAVRLPSDGNGLLARFTATDAQLANVMRAIAGSAFTRADLIWYVEAGDGDDEQKNRETGRPFGRLITVVQAGGPTPVEGGDGPAASFMLAQNHPNPFAAVTTIAYALPEAGAVRLEVYDMRGAVVRTLVDEHRAAGTHAISWDGRDDRGVTLPSGTYLTRLVAAGRALVRRMTIIR